MALSIITPAKTSSALTSSIYKTPTESDVNKFNSLYTSGKYEDAGKLASSFGFTPDQVSSYINTTYGAETTADQVQPYMLPSGVTQQKVQSSTGGLLSHSPKPSSTGGLLSSSQSAPTTSSGLLDSKPANAPVRVPKPMPKPIGDLNTLSGGIGPQNYMDEAYQSFYDKHVKGVAGAPDFNVWMESQIYEDNPYAPTLTGVRDAYNSYKSGTYATEAERQAAWKNVVGAGGNLTDQQWQDMYGQYLDPSATVKQQTKIQTEALGGATSEAPYKPIFNSAVNAPTETIEGRIQNLLNQNNPVIRQAGDRAMAAFAQRGLLNSSMAIEAANEAMISKAIEIAGPDAERYFQNRRQNVDWNNKFATNEQMHGYDLEKMEVAQQYAKELKMLDQSFQGQNLDKQYAAQLQTNYLNSLQNVETQYNQMVQAIQASEMNAADKTSAIEIAGIQKQNSVLFTTEAFSMMPQWQASWSSLTGGAGPIAEAPEGIDLAKPPESHSRTQIYKAIQYAAQDPSYMTDEQFKVWAQAAANKGLLSQEAYNALVS